MPRGGNAAASSSSPAPAPAEPGAAPASISRGVKLSRKKHLVATEVGVGAWIVRGVLSPKEASRLVSSADARGYARATSRGPKHGEARRDHGRAGYDDDAFAVALWRDTGLAEAVDASPIADLVAARGGPLRREQAEGPDERGHLPKLKHGRRSFLSRCRSLSLF